MSSNRLIYDTCASETSLDQSTSPLAYQLNPLKYENCTKCRMELGLVGGTNVSHIKGNLVDLENDLRGQTRVASKCPSMKYKPNCAAADPNACQTDCAITSVTIPAKGCSPARTLDATMQHLPPCQMIRYKPVPLPKPMVVQGCALPADRLPSPPARCTPAAAVTC
jgi:hypothetical protein